MRTRLDEQLDVLRKELTILGSLCEEAILSSVKMLKGEGLALIDKVRAIDDEIKLKEREIEGLCFGIILRQQPVARDLRQVSAALKMITDMERIGKQAFDIVELVGYLEGGFYAESELIVELSSAALKMVTKSVDAYVNQDVNLALSVIEGDDVVDELFQRVKISLIDFIVNNSEEGGPALDLLMIAKYFERIGDHAVNIAEWVLFSLGWSDIGEE